jgi:hypothetical protein
LRALPTVALVAALLIGAVIAADLGIDAFYRSRADFHVGPPGTLHSVLLTNGQVYYGRLAGITRSAVVLDDVFYVQVSVDPKSNERTNKLVSREENDWHGPTRMSIPLDKVEFIEIVGERSTVAKLIAEAQRKK